MSQSIKVEALGSYEYPLFGSLVSRGKSAVAVEVTALTLAQPLCGLKGGTFPIGQFLVVLKTFLEAQPRICHSSLLKLL